MMRPFKSAALVAIATTAVDFATSAQATTFDTTLIDPPGVYFGTGNVNTGTTSEPGKTGTDWGFVFSINTNANGLGSLMLADISARICIQDVSQGLSSCFNPLAIPDNAHASGSPTTTA